MYHEEWRGLASSPSSSLAGVPGTTTPGSCSSSDDGTPPPALVAAAAAAVPAAAAGKAAGADRGSAAAPPVAPLDGAAGVAVADGGAAHRTAAPARPGGHAPQREAGVAARRPVAAAPKGTATPVRVPMTTPEGGANATAARPDSGDRPAIAAQLRAGGAGEGGAQMGGRGNRGWGEGWCEREGRRVGRAYTGISRGIGATTADGEQEDQSGEKETARATLTGSAATGQMWVGKYGGAADVEGSQP